MDEALIWFDFLFQYRVHTYRTAARDNNFENGLDFTFNVCKIYSAKSRHIVLKIAVEQVLRALNMEVKCPFRKVGEKLVWIWYHRAIKYFQGLKIELRNIKIDPTKYPSFLLNFKRFKICNEIYTKVKGQKKALQLFNFKMILEIR